MSFAAQMIDTCVAAASTLERHGAAFYGFAQLVLSVHPDIRGQFVTQALKPRFGPLRAATLLAVTNMVAMGWAVPARHHALVETMIEEPTSVAAAQFLEQVVVKGPGADVASTVEPAPVSAPQDAPVTPPHGSDRLHSGEQGRVTTPGGRGADAAPAPASSHMSTGGGADSAQLQPGAIGAHQGATTSPTPPGQPPGTSVCGAPGPPVPHIPQGAPADPATG